MKSELTDKAFINITYHMNNIRIYRINGKYWIYHVNETHIIPLESKYAIKICNEVLKYTNGCHLSNLIFAFPSTYNDKDKIKIKKLCKSQFLNKETLLGMLLLLK